MITLAKDTLLSSRTSLDLLEISMADAHHSILVADTCGVQGTMVEPGDQNQTCSPHGKHPRTRWL
jgi:hypothetical protein